MVDIIESKRNQDETIWLPKVICVLSPYLFYDKTVEIVKKLVDMFQDNNGMGDESGLPNLFEALVYEIVFKIETPVRKAVSYRDVKIQSSMTIYSLPYISESFFDTLFR